MDLSWFDLFHKFGFEHLENYTKQLATVNIQAIDS